MQLLMLPRSAANPVEFLTRMLEVFFDTCALFIAVILILVQLVDWVDVDIQQEASQLSIHMFIETILELSRGEVIVILKDH
ncbi:MAG: hypothetical protein A6F71_07500 [Cycloclasticus sp. symbiont of Poecilosclerida sp. M]|nr:MAG: hypothetical protein A6F71_07500 [Cycloclasticus sp. symbiont of Poecilosclerida sp. M]